MLCIINKYIANHMHTARVVLKARLPGSDPRSNT